MRKALLFLGVLNDADLDWLMQVGALQTLPAGTRLIQQGEPLEHMFVVLEGLFAVTVKGAGDDPVEVARLRAGEILGEMSFVDSRPPSATVTVLEPSLVLAVPKSSLRARLEHPEFASRFYRALALFLADRLRISVSRLGYGPVEPESGDDELDPEVLAAVTIAGARFDWMLRRLRGY